MTLTEPLVLLVVEQSGGVRQRGQPALENLEMSSRAKDMDGSIHQEIYLESGLVVEQSHQCYQQRQAC